MTTNHELIGPYLSGELSEQEADRFRDHLVDCPTCQRALLGGLWIEKERRASVGRRFNELMRRRPLAASLAALVLLGSSARTAAGLWPVTLDPGRTRGHQEWIDGPLAEAHREYARPSTPMGPDGPAVDDQYLEAQQRIDWMFGKRRRLWASVENALIHSEDKRARGFIEQVDRLKDTDPKLAASLANARAVLALREARGHSAADCATSEDVKVQSACEVRRHQLIEALGFLGKTLEKDPLHAPSLFNRALVLRELGLEAAAAEAFEAVAASDEPGWREEAAREAGTLRGRIQQQQEHADQQAKALSELTSALWAADADKPDSLGQLNAALSAVRAQMQDQAKASRDQEPFLKELYRMAPGATAFQRKLLAPLAAELGLPKLAERLGQPGSAAAAAHAERYRRWDRLSPADQRALVADADRSGEDELLLAILSWSPSGGREYQVPEQALSRVAQAAEKDGEPYAATLARRLHGQWLQNASRTAEAMVELEALAKACDPVATPGRCSEIERRLAYACRTVERWSDAETYSLKGMALVDPASKLWLAHVEMLGQIASFQSGDDPFLALAYSTELHQRTKECTEYRARAAARIAMVDVMALGDFGGGVRMMDEAIRAQSCLQPIHLGLPGLIVMAALIGGKRAPPEWSAQLEAGFDALPDHSADSDERVPYLGARAALGREEPGATARLEALAKERDARLDPGQVERSEAEVAEGTVRSYAYRDLALEAAERGDFARALDMVSRQLRLQAPERCAMAVTSDLGRTAVAIRDAAGAVDGAYTARSEWRWLDGHGDALVPTKIQERLGGCEQVSVLASPGVFGFSRLLARIPWSYLVAQVHAGQPGPSEHRLVVANTDPPESLRLERLNEWNGRRDASTRVLEHEAATLSRLKEELPGATDVELYMHGLQRAMDAEGPYLALTPDRKAGGEFKLTAQVLRPLELAGAPYVYLKACRAADAGSQNYSNRGLAEAFVERGARAVFAATVPIPDREADAFFNAIRERIRAGKAPAVALAEARAEYVAPGEATDWMADVVALEPAPVRR